MCDTRSGYIKTFGGWHSTEVAFALPTQLARVQVSVFPKFFLILFFPELFLEK